MHGGPSAGEDTRAQDAAAPCASGRSRYSTSSAEYSRIGEIADLDRHGKLHVHAHAHAHAPLGLAFVRSFAGEIVRPWNAPWNSATPSRNRSTPSSVTPRRPSTSGCDNGRRGPESRASVVHGPVSGPNHPSSRSTDRSSSFQVQSASDFSRDLDSFGDSAIRRIEDRRNERDRTRRGAALPDLALVDRIHSRTFRTVELRGELRHIRQRADHPVLWRTVRIFLDL